MTKRRICVIGGNGSIGQRHAHHLEDLGHEVIIFDPPAKWSEEHRARMFEFAMGNSEAAVIASPTNLHCRHISDIQHGKPLFIEKPLGATQGDYEFLSDRQWLPADMIGYNLRFHSCVIMAKQWIEAGLLGAPLWANFVCAQKNHKYKDHVILNWSHEIDLANYLFDGSRVMAAAGSEWGADIILAHKHWQSTVHLDYVTEPEIRQDIIVGDKATIIMDLVNRAAWLRSADGHKLAEHLGEDTWQSNYYDEMETFLARLDGKETVGCTGKEGLDVLRLCLDAINISAAGTIHGSSSISLPNRRSAL